MMKISTFKEAMKFAIEREREAIKTYETLIHEVTTPGLKEMLRSLQKEEENHKRLLEELSQEDVDSFPAVDIVDLKISDSLEGKGADFQMNLQDLLIFAAKKEKEAAEFYARLAQEARVPKLKKFFEFLVLQEKSHKLKLETEYDQYIYGED